MPGMDPMTSAQYGAHLAAQAPPLTEAQVEAAARILAAVSARPLWVDFPA